jgi:hypothetical protein
VFSTAKQIVQLNRKLAPPPFSALSGVSDPFFA